MERRKVPDEMLEAIARLMFERLAPSSRKADWAGTSLRTKERYRDAAGSVLLLADEYWQ